MRRDEVADRVAAELVLRRARRAPTRPPPRRRPRAPRRRPRRSARRAPAPPRRSRGRPSASGFISVGSGFIAARTTISSPFEMPASMPPAWFVSRRRSVPISSCASEPRSAGEREPVADLDTLHGLDPHHARRRAARRAGRPSTRRSRARAARRVARTSTTPPTVSRSARASSIRACRPSSSTVAPATSIPIVAQQRLRDRARGDVHGRVPRRRALERVADVVVAVLQDAGEVGVARAAAASPASCPCPDGSPSGGHGAIPHVQFLWSTVPHDERERRAERAAVAEAGEHLDAVLLDLLARRAAVALLPALQVGVDRSRGRARARRAGR